MDYRNRVLLRTANFIISFATAVQFSTAAFAQTQPKVENAKGERVVMQSLSTAQRQREAFAAYNPIVQSPHRFVVGSPAQPAQ